MYTGHAEHLNWLLTCLMSLLLTHTLAHAEVLTLEQVVVPIGVLAKRGAKMTHQKWDATAAYLSTKIPGYRFEIVPLDFGQIFTQTEQGKIDFVLTNSAMYVRLEIEYQILRIASLRNRLGEAVTSCFGGVLFTRHDHSSLRSYADLYGQRFAAVDHDSLGGYLAVLRELQAHGLKPQRDFASLRFLGTHDAVVYAVRDGYADVGIVRSDTLERMAEEGYIKLSDYYVFPPPSYVQNFPFQYSTRLYPEWPLAALAHTNVELAHQVAQALLDMPMNHLAARTAQTMGWGVAANYQPVHDLLRELQLPPYLPRGLNLDEVLHAYWLWIVVICLTLLIIIISTWHVYRINHRLIISQRILKDTVSKMQQEICQRQRIENALSVAKEQAEAANHSKSIFLANMSHELRTPLNAILGFCQLIAQSPETNASQQEKLTIINRSGEHLLNMINDVLDLSKIEAGRIELNPETFDLPRLIHDVGQMFELRAESTSLHFMLELDAECARYVKADNGKLRQILINLLGNALKFTLAGGIALRVRTLSVPEDPDLVLLCMEVEDNGPGIPPEQQAHIFEPFVTARSAANDVKGTGLGLAISKSFIELMGGNIQFESVPNQGSLFRIELPLVHADSVTASDPSTSKSVVTGLAPGEPVWRVLVVEDIPENRLLLTTLLLQVGFEVREAHNGAEAIALFKAWSPDFIWMDIRMPVLDGYAATKAIRALPHGKEVKIVALTASAFMEQRANILAAGCDDLLHKPFRIHEIFNVMARHLTIHYSYETISETITQNENPHETDLARMPKDIVQALSKAVLELDEERVTEIAACIRHRDTALADSILGLIRQYRYEELMTLCEQVLKTVAKE